DERQPYLSRAERDERGAEQGHRRPPRRGANGSRARGCAGQRAMSAPLYNRDILALAVATADYPLPAKPRRRASLRAPLCGSRIIVDLDADKEGRITAVGLHVEACALGQASAALLARHAPG